MRGYLLKTSPILVAIMATALYTIFVLSVGAFAINPGVGEGADLDPASFRYRAGDFIDGHVLPVLALPFLPGLFLRSVLHVTSKEWDMFRCH